MKARSVHVGLGVVSMEIISIMQTHREMVQSGLRLILLPKR